MSITTAKAYFTELAIRTRHTTHAFELLVKLGYHGVDILPPEQNRSHKLSHMSNEYHYAAIGWIETCLTTEKED